MGVQGPVVAGLGRAQVPEDFVIYIPFTLFIAMETGRMNDFCHSTNDKAERAKVLLLLSCTCHHGLARGYCSALERNVSTLGSIRTHKPCKSILWINICHIISSDVVGLA